MRRRARNVLAAIVAAAAAMGGPQGAPASEGDALARILERGEIRFGYRADAPPFSYADAGRRPAGLAVRLCEEAAPAIAAAAGAPGPLPVVWVAQTAATRFEALTRGDTDLHCGPATQTLTRRRTLDFSIPWYVDGAGLVFRKGGPERLEDLRDDRVGVLRGTTTEAVARRVLAERAPLARLVLHESHVAGLEALQRGEIEAYMGDRSILLYQLGRMRPTLPPVLSTEALSREPYALAMRRGETRLRLAVDAELSRIYAAGRMRDLIVETLGRAPASPDVEAIYEVVTIPE